MMFFEGMPWAAWAALVFFLLHVFVWLKLIRGFRKARSWYGPTRNVVERTFWEAFEGEWPSLSVIIAARNEEQMLPRLLDALQRQTHDRFEVIVVDDGSEDGTASLVEHRAREDDRIRLVRMEHGGKKAAVKAGVAAARYPVCVFTDADCRPSSGWLAAHALAHRGTSRAVVVGYSPLEGSDSWLVSFQQFDTSLSQFLAAAAIGDGQAYLAKGGNLSYSRVLHEEVGGFEGHVHRLSGDDTLFVQTVRRESTAVVRWLDMERATVPSPARERLGAWLRQKRRQTSTGATFDRVGMMRAASFHWTLLLAVLFGLLSGGVVLVGLWLALVLVFVLGLRPVSRAFRKPFPAWTLPLFLPAFIVFITLVPAIGMLFPPAAWQAREP